MQRTKFFAYATFYDYVFKYNFEYYNAYYVSQTFLFHYCNLMLLLWAYFDVSVNT